MNSECRKTRERISKEMNENKKKSKLNGEKAHNKSDDD
jgi:hypothetical protein